MIKENKFTSIESFINHFKKNDFIIGIVEYGGRTYTDVNWRRL